MANDSAAVTILPAPENGEHASKERKARARRLRESLERGAAEIAHAAFVRLPRGIEVTLRNGVRIFMPLGVIDLEALSAASDDDLADIGTDNSACLIVDFPRLDEGFSVSGLLIDLFRETARLELNRAAGERSTPKKAAAARRNGRKGGRPKKKRTRKAA